MPSSYLLQCDCGADHRVKPNQAGTELTCECGRTLRVPTLRNLRHLPRVEAEPAPTSSTWSLRQAVATAGAVVTLVLLAWAAWLWFSEPEVPELDLARSREAMDAWLEQVTPQQLYLRFHYEYDPLAERGFEEVRLPQIEEAKERRAQQQLYRNVVLAAAGVAAVATVAAWAAIPSTKTQARI